VALEDDRVDVGLVDGRTRVGVVVGREQHEGEVESAVVDRRRELEPAQLGHPVVGDDGVELLGGESVQRGRAAAGRRRLDGRFEPFEEGRRQVEDVPVLVDDQHANVLRHPRPQGVTLVSTAPSIRTNP
jgi:hypothetical protein